MLFERSSWLCIPAVAICGEGLWVFVFRVRREMKGWETSDVNFVRKKSCFSTRKLHKLSIIDEKMLLLTGKIEKAYLVRNLFLFTWTKKFLPFFSNWKPGAQKNSRMLITFFRSEDLDSISSRSSGNEPALLSRFRERRKSRTRPRESNNPPSYPPSL